MGTQGRAQFYSVIKKFKKRQEVSTETERERSSMPDIFRYAQLGSISAQTSLSTSLSLVSMEYPGSVDVSDIPWFRVETVLGKNPPSYLGNGYLKRTSKRNIQKHMEYSYT